MSLGEGFGVGFRGVVGGLKKVLRDMGEYLELGR